MEDLGELYQLYAQTVYRFLYSKCRDGPMAEELTQETFYRAVYSIKRWDGSCQITTWLCRIAYHVWQQTLEKENRRMRNRGVQPRVDKSPSAEEEVLAADGEMALWKALHRLREPAREVLYLRLFGGLSFRQIGEIMEKSETWARVTFFRGKNQMMKGSVQDDEGRPNHWMRGGAGFAAAVCRTDDVGRKHSAD